MCGIQHMCMPIILTRCVLVRPAAGPEAGSLQEAAASSKSIASIVAYLIAGIHYAF